jgi:hypothetical protein
MNDASDIYCLYGQFLGPIKNFDMHRKRMQRGMMDRGFTVKSVED